MAELSPAARAVLDAMHRSYDHEPTRRLIAADILRALADQVKPCAARTPWLTNEDNYFNETFENMETLGELVVYNKILAIAAELEGADG